MRCSPKSTRSVRLEWSNCKRLSLCNRMSRFCTHKNRSCSHASTVKDGSSRLHWWSMNQYARLFLDTKEVSLTARCRGSVDVTIYSCSQMGPSRNRRIRPVERHATTQRSIRKANHLRALWGDTHHIVSGPRIKKNTRTTKKMLPCLSLASVISCRTVLVTQIIELQTRKNMPNQSCNLIKTQKRNGLAVLLNGPRSTLACSIKNNLLQSQRTSITNTSYIKTKENHSHSSKCCRESARAFQSRIKMRVMPQEEG